MVEVFLTPWEWQCCGTPFCVGERVEFTLGDAGSWLDELLEGTGHAGVLREMHHEDPPTDVIGGSVSGVVHRIDLVTQEHVVRQVRRERPAQPRRTSQGNGVWMSTRPSEFVRTSEPVDGTTVLVETDRVPREREVAPMAKPPDGERVRGVVGYLVALDAD